MKSELTRMPGAGNDMAEHLTRAGYPTIESLKEKNDDIYTADCFAQGITVDRCALYCYRLAVYYADHDGQFINL